MALRDDRAEEATKELVRSQRAIERGQQKLQAAMKVRAYCRP